jgi:hypothetical protein
VFGLSLGGKTVVIFSADGLNDTARCTAAVACGGNEIGTRRR